MIWLWRICFSGLWLLLPLWCANLRGNVVLTDSRDPGVRHNKDFRGVVVWLEPADGKAPMAGAPHRYRMEQKEKHFIPHVLAVPVGAVVDFPNRDPIYHNVFSNYSGKVFDLVLYPPGTSKRQSFDRPGIVRVFCNIHPTMSAVIAVLDTPWFAVSDITGAFEIRDVPPGSYVMHVFHERATDETLHALVQPVTVDKSTPPALQHIQISETGYIPAPHKNKWNKDYPPAPDDQPAYRPTP